MDWAHDCAVVIPCYNEEAAIASVVTAVRAQVHSVLVVDDGSQDDTAEKARQAGAHIIRHPGNLGKGAALKSGLQSALSQGFAWALTLDGDGQHSPQDIPGFWRCAEQTNAELVIGNRMGQAGAMPWLRRSVNLWMSRNLSARLGTVLPDTQCGFRLVKLNAWARVCLRTTHFEIESETLAEFLKAGFRVEFVPVPVISKPSGSKIHPLIDTCRWLRWWFRGTK